MITTLLIVVAVLVVVDLVANIVVLTALRQAGHRIPAPRLPKLRGPKPRYYA